MRPFDPLGESAPVPAILEQLSTHPERGRWEAAGLFRLTSPRWPRWPLRLALATVDSQLEHCVTEFMVRPAHGWVENEQYAAAPDLSVQRVVETGLSARQAVLLLNDILGTMRVAHNWGCNELSAYQLQQACGVRPTWSWPALLAHDSMRELTLGTEGFVIFGTRLPREGTLLERATGWATSSVATRRAYRILHEALAGTSLRPEAP